MSELKHTPGPLFVHDATKISNDGIGYMGTFSIINKPDYVKGAKVLAYIPPLSGYRQGHKVSHCLNPPL